MRSLQPQVKAIQERYAGDQVIIFYMLAMLSFDFSTVAAAVAALSSV
jgi:hypothetical protein